MSQSNALERRVSRLELVAMDTMKASVVDFFRRVPSGQKSRPRWVPEMYPTGSEKELYPEFAHILLSCPGVMVPALLGLFRTPVAQRLLQAPLTGSWRAYRLSTVRLEKGVRWTGPICFPGAAGYGAIADVGFFLNPSYDGADGKQVRADKILYFEIKSADHHSHKASQLQAHLEALERETPPGVGFLAAVGGRRTSLDHPRWLGHVTLDSFLRGMYQAAVAELANSRLAAEIEELRVRRCS